MRVWVLIRIDPDASDKVVAVFDSERLVERAMLLMRRRNPTYLWDYEDFEVNVLD